MIIVHGDVLKNLPKKGSMDLIVTSPPYNCGIPYDEHDDNMVWGDYLGWCWWWLKGCYDALKSDGRIALNVLVEMGIQENRIRVSPMAEFYNLLKDVGFKIMGMPMWTDNHRGKNTAWGSWRSASCPYIYNPYEVVILGYKERKKRDDKGLDTISSKDFMRGCMGVWDFPTDKERLTPATFPVELPKLCIELLSFRGDWVLDPFMGSGTTGVAAVLTGRNFYGIELSKNYVEIAEKRIIEIFDSRRPVREWVKIYERNDGVRFEDLGLLKDSMMTEYEFKRAVVEMGAVPMGYGG